ncbi:MAG: hypothetical protein K2N12_09935, partial [Helicobacter sp.]|nr:hypothetical protein [Helicobacter sp.]
YDTVRIDLSKTSGVNLDISKLLVSNPNNEGIVITASKGADNITLTAGANHDIIEFNAGSGSSQGAREVYSVDLGNLRLANSQSFSIDGLTITNVGDTGIVRAAEIAQAIAAYANNGTITAGFNITGKLNSLTGDWAGATTSASGGVLNITAQPNRNLKDLNLTFTGNESTNAPTDITAQITAGAASASASIQGLIETSPATPESSATITPTTKFKFGTGGTDLDVTSGGSSILELTINGETYTITASNSDTTADKAASLAGVIAAINATNGTATDATNTEISYAITDSNGDAANLTGLVTASDSSGELVLEPVTQSSADGAITLTSPATGGFANATNGTYTAKAYQPAASASYAFTFVNIGTPAQAYQPAASAQSSSAATITPTTKFKFGTGGTDLDVTSGGSSILELTINGETYTITASNSDTTADKAASLAGVIAAINATNGTATDATNTEISYAITDSNGDAANLTGLVTASDSSGELVLEPVTQSSADGAITLTSPATGGFANATNGTYTAKAYQPETPAQDQIGTPASVSPVGSDLVWTGKALSADQAGTEVLKVSIAGNVYSIKATAPKDTTVTPADIIEMLGTGSGTTNGITYTITNSAGGAEAATKVKDVLANVGVKVDTTAGGIAGNEIKLVIDNAANLPTTASTITITPSNVYNANNTAVSWSAQAEQGIAAQPDTATISINGHNIVFSDVLLTAAQLETAVFELITNGTLDSLSASDRAKVSIDGQTFNRANAKENKAMFTIEGAEYRQVSGGGIELVLTDPTTYTGNASFEFSQTNGNGDGSNQTFNVIGAHGDSYGQIVVTFNALAAGQSYTFDGKTIIATKNLSANEVANAFTLTTDDTVDGAVVVSDFENIGEDVLYYVAAGSSTLTIQGTSLTSIPAGINPTITGTGSLGVNTSGVSASTTTQGSDGAGTKADSYVVFTETTNDAGEIVSIAANTSAMDTISNFDVANDGLRLRDGVGGYYGEGQVATSVSNHTIYVAPNSTLTATIANGILSFGVNNNDSGSATVDNITLDQKLHVATHDIGTNKVAGFEHGGDFYIIATGGISGASTDDIVVKLNGVSGVSDITNLLA